MTFTEYQKSESARLYEKAFKNTIQLKNKKQETAKKNEDKKRKYAVICDNQLCYLSDDFLIIRKDEREEIIDFGSQAVYSAYVYFDGAGTIYKESYIQKMVDKDQYLNKILKMKDYLIHLWDGDHLFDIAYL